MRKVDEFRAGPGAVGCLAQAWPNSLHFGSTLIAAGVVLCCARRVIARCSKPCCACCAVLTWKWVMKILILVMIPGPCAPNRQSRANSAAAATTSTSTVTASIALAWPPLQLLKCNGAGAEGKPRCRPLSRPRLA